MLYFAEHAKVLHQMIEVALHPQPAEFAATTFDLGPSDLLREMKLAMEMLNDEHLMFALRELLTDRIEKTQEELAA